MIQTILYAVMLTALFCFSSVSSAEDISLNGAWKLKYFPQSNNIVMTPRQAEVVDGYVIDAMVPGNVELDLLAAGVIEDPMIGNNVYDLRKYEGYQWCYSRSFVSPETTECQRVVLTFEGLDTFAEIYVNGKHAGSTDNMLISHSFDITGLLNKAGTNELDVIIRSSVLEVQKYALGVLSIGNFANEESTYARRAPHTYGWDIMPRLVSAGIWRGVMLKVENQVRIEDTNWITAEIDKENKTAQLYLQLQTAMPFDRFDKVKAIVSLSRSGKKVHESSHLMHRFAEFIHIGLTDVDFWWPRGYGEPALYDAEVSLVDVATGEVLSYDSERIGIRTVALDMKDVNLPDSPGQFRFIINGVPVFAKGTNWVPLDALHSRDIMHLDKAVDLMVEMNCNIVRCWGGNVYEDTRFFDLCDENGIMVWQDFSMGCNIYSQRDDFARAVEKEAVSVVRKFRSHPSLILWSGNNENDQVVVHGRLKSFRLNPNMDRVSREVLPRVVFEFDPTRPYLASSPYYSPRVYQAGGTDNVLPENHLWGPRGYYKDDFYVKADNQFVSEIGYHGCPNRESLERMFTKDCVYPWIDGKPGMWNDEWQTKAIRIYNDKFQGGRNDLMTNQVKILFGKVPEKLDDFIFASQSVQAEAMKFFVEFWRGDRPARNGIIWWNIRDGWPILSDAITDYYGGKKMAFHFLKNVHHDVCVFVNDPVDGTYKLKVSNDTMKDVPVKITVKDVESGKVLYSGEAMSLANTSVKIASIPEQDGQGLLVINYEIGSEKYFNHYLYGRPPFDLQDYKAWIKKVFKNN